MDPFSISTGIIGLAAVVAQTLSMAKTYVSAVRNAKSSISTMIAELEALQTNLEKLHAFCNNNAASSLSLSSTSSLQSCISACELKVRDLGRKLGQGNGTRMSRYLWPMSEKEHTKTIQELRGFGQWIELALSLDGISLLSQTSDNLLEVLKQQEDGYRLLQAIDLRTTELQQNQDRHLLAHEGRYRTEKERMILDWLSTEAQAQKHRNVCSMRVEGTCAWLLDQPSYINWREGTSESNILWCYGAQGSGKTVLASWIIEDLSLRDESSVAFYYFDYQDRSSRSIGYILCSILRQLVANLTAIPNIVIETYHKSYTPAAFLPAQELEMMIQAIIQNTSETYLVIDALDECECLFMRKGLMGTIRRLSSSQCIHVLIMSRPHSLDVDKKALLNYHSVEVRAHEADLKAYICMELQNANMHLEINHSLANQIIETLVHRAQGMFLLPILHLRSVLNQPTLGDMEDALTNLPLEIFDAFQDTLDRIYQLPEARARLGINSLTWICLAERALTVKELSDALAIRPGQISQSAKYRPSREMIIECCQGLVCVEPLTNHVRFSHYTIHEYLSQHISLNIQVPHKILSDACQTYLLSNCPQTAFQSNEIDIISFINSNPLVSYAAEYWGTHARHCQTTGSVNQLTALFLSNQKALQYSWQIMRFTQNYKEIYWDPAECWSVTPLHAACHFGLETVLLRLLDYGMVPKNMPTTMGTTPIIQAASRGHIDIVEELLSRGANPYLANWYGNALHCAAEAGHAAVVTRLIDHGMSPIPCIYYKRSPLSCTVDRDSFQAFHALVKAGADPATFDEFGLTVLHNAALHNSIEIIRVITDEGLVDLERRCSAGLTALYYAISHKHLIAFRKLIEAGANIHAMSTGGLTLLDFATKNGCQEAIDILVRRGATTTSEVPDY
ncbi:hypothetical protein AARAC_000488 [Aspergillus arachidicola]|uniref:Uncharacterized protein n=1 Tax=Aspergillus arachidicola TaxID=656916 RepID=A0A2G7G9M8_9EURO|nr:hypothetical protein AARAC_000488 [Aspergillus arachidicola]